MFFISVFVVSWSVFAFLSDKTRLRELLPISLLGMVMSLASDVITHTFPFWSYHDINTHFPPISFILLDDFGIYPVIAFLYVQFLPKTLLRWFLYTLAWSTGGITVESLMIYIGYMKHHLVWTLWISYVADWIIFTILTLCHRWFSRTRGPRYCFTIDSSNKAVICFEQQIQSVEPTHLLHNVTRYPGVNLYQATHDGNAESFLVILDSDTQTPVHHHAGHEIHFLVEGAVAITVNGQETPLHQGQLFHFPSSAPHSFRNLGNTSAKLISIVYQDQEPLTGEYEMSPSQIPISQKNSLST